MYKTGKKIRYTLAIVYVLFMTFIVGGSYIHQQQKPAQQNAFVE